jgi:hypothetical protein
MSAPVWRKSSRSGTGGVGGEDCVEVAQLPGSIGFRDSKWPENGHLSVSREHFASLVVQVKRSDLDL